MGPCLKVEWIGIFSNVQYSIVGGAVASWLVRMTQDRMVWV